jgi:hypothetical protein
LRPAPESLQRGLTQRTALTPEVVDRRLVLLEDPGLGHLSVRDVGDMRVPIAEALAVLLTGDGRERNGVRVVGDDVVELGLEGAVGLREVRPEERQRVIDAGVRAAVVVVAPRCATRCSRRTTKPPSRDRPSGMPCIRAERAPRWDGAMVLSSPLGSR